MSYRSEKSGVKVDELLDKIDSLGNATQSTDGLLSKEDKKKLDDLANSPASNITEADINKWNNKQDTIDDLAAIREGAALGATAIQEHQDISGKADKTAVDAALATKADKSTTYTKEEVDGLIDGVDVSEQLENYYTKDETDAAMAGKQDTISDLSTIRSGAAAGATAVQPAGLTPIESALQTIEAVIPSAATAQNQLADKNFVNSSISTNTANFVGTYNSLAELQAVQNPTNNDYGFVIETDAHGNEYYDRYKYVAASQQWLFEYKVESTPFTAAQWAAIQSGITSALVTKLNALPTNAELQQALDDKADTSDIPTALSQLSQDSTHRTVTDTEKSTWNGKQDIIDDLADIREGAALGATAIQEHQDISGKADKTAVDAALATKADASSVYTKAETDTMLEGMVICTDDDGSASTASFDAQADTVWNKAQTLSSAQQAQARSNIGAQEALVSGTNIKTINNESILGSGNITISGGGGDVSGKEDKSNKVTSLSASSTDTQYPSAKCVYDLIGDVESLLAAI